MALFLLIAGYLQILEMSRPHVSGDRIRLDSFVDLAEQGRLLDAELLDQDAYVVGRYERADGTVRRYNMPYLKTTNTRERLVDVLVDNRVPTTIQQQFVKGLVIPATLLLPALMFVVVAVYLILSYSKGTGMFAVRSGARRIGADEVHVTFADVAGQDAAIAELREVAGFLSDPERFAAVGARVPKGILLYGPPGCGKTLLAKALAGEAGASFYSISGSDFIELYVGVGAARVRDLFREARENVPALVFIDELDSVGRRRTTGGPGAHGSSEEQEQALNQILAEMDGFSPSQGIILIGATNRPDVLDPALLRPGRFDRAIGLETPDEDGRLAILEVHARDKRIEAGADLKSIAVRAVGMTGADLASVMNEAALLAARAGRSVISQAELDRAVERILEAPERQRRLSMRDRSLGRRSLAEERVTFADVAGVDDAIVELREVKDYLANPEFFLEIGATVPRGFLLVGPPGCGKTLLARAVAGESNAAFFSVAASEFTEIFVGEGAARVRDLFAEAKGVAPAIVFIDEIDAIGARRGAGPGDGSREREQTLNQILIELDGFGARDGVIVMAATNRPDILDPALLRAGRFDRQVTVEPPDRAGRRAILEVHARKKRLAADVDLDAVAGLTHGLSGADLANVMNEAALLTARRGLREIPVVIVEEAIERSMLGIASRGRAMSDEERMRVAFHEGGHAIVGLRLPGASPPHKLTILPRGRSLGYVWHPTADRHLNTRSGYLDEIAALLAGSLAEEIVFGESGDGAAGDFRRVSELVHRMVRELGMSKSLGRLLYADGASGDGKSLRYSEETARLIDDEARKVVEEATERARRILMDERGALERVAKALLEKESLTADEFERIIAAPAPPSRTPRRAAAG
ncbi:MAG TPA: AAA family ATPase [Actinomycetota bacterium]|nr:AAA family ATPase [Actinomycetota bacterium]